MYVINPKTKMVDIWTDNEINRKRLSSGKYGVEYYNGEVQKSDIDGLLYAKEFCPMKTEEEKIKEYKEQFETDFFLTSLGYIRRKVTMANGDTKDFLTDLLPSIAMGIQLGQPVSIITYKEPDFTEEITDLVKYQEVKKATADFIQECFMRLNNDFMPKETNGAGKASESSSNQPANENKETVSKTEMVEDTEENLATAEDVNNFKADGK